MSMANRVVSHWLDMTLATSYPRACWLGSAGAKKILVVGAGGTAVEMLAMAALEPQWRES